MAVPDVFNVGRLKRLGMTGMVNGIVAIVTGGGRGLGRSMALGLVRAGAKVAITAARQGNEIEAVAAEAVEIAGADVALPIIADVADPAACTAVVERTLEAFGRLDVLINNAARGMRFIDDDFMTGSARFWHADPEAWRMVIDTNVNGPFLMARAVMPTFLGQRRGKIVNVTIAQGTMSRAGFSPYGPSKAALESATVIWAAECADTGVTVNCLLPGGATLTGMIPDGVSDDIRKGLLDPEIIVPPLLWLASDASGGHSGERYNAIDWDGALPPDEAAAKARGPAGWPLVQAG